MKINYNTKKAFDYWRRRSWQGRCRCCLKDDKWKYIAFLDQDETIKSLLDIDVIDRSENAFKYIKDYDTAILEPRGSDLES